MNAEGGNAKPAPGCLGWALWLLWMIIRYLLDKIVTILVAWALFMCLPVLVLYAMYPEHVTNIVVYGPLFVETLFSRVSWTHLKTIAELITQIVKD